jgi:hypothetical protein
MNEAAFGILAPELSRAEGVGLNDWLGFISDSEAIQELHDHPAKGKIPVAPIGSYEDFRSRRASAREGQDQGWIFAESHFGPVVTLSIRVINRLRNVIPCVIADVMPILLRQETNERECVHVSNLAEFNHMKPNA